MASVGFQYGGVRGEKRKLVDANDFLVVRTKRRGSLEYTPLSEKAHRAIKGSQSVVHFEEAGVEVLKFFEGSRPTTKRNQARTVLKQESEIQFAGRVLCSPQGRQPVVYTENLFVKFNDDVSPRRCRNMLRQYNLSMKREVGYARNAYFVSAQENAGRMVFDIAFSLLAKKEVELCHPELVQAMSHRQAFSEQWHLHKTRIDGKELDQHASVVAAWSFTKGEGVTIAVIDDGFDTDHEEFAGSNKVVAPYDMTRRRKGAWPMFPKENHGTACAGVACANGNHKASGVAPRAKLLPIRQGSGVGSQDEADAIIWAADHGADIISCSWGPKGGDFEDPDDPRHDEIFALPDSTRKALLHAIENGRNGKGCVITWAAGNGNASVDNDGYASFDKVIAIGASDDKGKRAPYSNFGNALWCLFPSAHDLPSDTKGIWTTDRGGGNGYNSGIDTLGDAEGHYTNGFGGTSSACPGAAGIAALVLSRNADLRWDQVKEILAQSCDQIDHAQAGYDARGHSTHYGFGRLNALRAVELAQPPHPNRSVVHKSIQEVPISDHEISTIEVMVHDSVPIRNLRVDVNIEHSYSGDLVVKLLPPFQLGLDPITLQNREGNSQPHVKRIFDSANNSRLRDLVGIVPTGTWILQVHDQGNEDEGRIIHFAVELDF